LKSTAVEHRRSRNAGAPGRERVGRDDPTELHRVDAQGVEPERPQGHHDHEIGGADELHRREREQYEPRAVHANPFREGWLSWGRRGHGSARLHRRNVAGSGEALYYHGELPPGPVSGE